MERGNSIEIGPVESGAPGTRHISQPGRATAPIGREGKSFSAAESFPKANTSAACTTGFTPPVPCGGVAPAYQGARRFLSTALARVAARLFALERFVVSAVVGKHLRERVASHAHEVAWRTYACPRRRHANNLAEAEG
jgi:hypothetical protein